MQFVLEMLDRFFAKCAGTRTGRPMSATTAAKLPESSVCEQQAKARDVHGTKKESRTVYYRTGAKNQAKKWSEGTKASLRKKLRDKKMGCGTKKT